MDDQSPAIRSRKMRIDLNIGEFITSLFDRGIRPVKIEVTPHIVTLFFSASEVCDEEAFQNWGARHG